MFFVPLGVLLLAVLLDLLIGDPRSAWHPVALTGRLISAWERLLYRQGISPLARRMAGAMLVLGTVLPVWLLVYLCLAWLHRLYLPPAAGAHRGQPGMLQLWACIYLVAGAIFLWATISIRSLDRAAREILGMLRRGDLAEARRRLSFIVGRDTDRLDPEQITRATVETLAENISDGVIAPLFYFLLGGPALACAYRAVNTLDSMVGYRNERYRDFGMAAARLDDVANFLPARLTMLLLAGSALLLGLEWRQAWRLSWRDASKHPSPNSGYPEAAVAGALGVQLGGLNYYGGVPSLRALMGDPKEILAPRHIEAAIRMLYGTVALFLVITIIGWLLLARR
jgi:adenosylcobinamide-phosphate synthase